MEVRCYATGSQNGVAQIPLVWGQDHPDTRYGFEPEVGLVGSAIFSGSEVLGNLRSNMSTSLDTIIRTSPSFTLTRTH
jgi:hypothetical protein